MFEKNRIEKIKVTLDNDSQMHFIVKNLRSFYSKNILEWQYFNEDSFTTLYFSTYKSEIIACQGMLPIPLVSNKIKIKSAKSESSFLVKEYRGKGVFEDLYFHTIKESEKDGCELIWGFTALSKVWRDKLKFLVYDGVIYEAELQINAVIALKNIFYSNLSLTNKIKQSLKSIYLKSYSFRYNKNKDNDLSFQKLDFENEKETILNLYKNWTDKNKNFISINISEKFLNWRINNNPKINYEYIGAYKNGQLMSLIILNITHSKASIVDFIALNNDDIHPVLKGLTTFVREKFNFSHIHFWANSKNDYNKYILDIFNLMGAKIYQNKNMNFVVKRTKNFSLQADYFEDISNYCINGLWTEGFNI